MPSGFVGGVLLGCLLAVVTETGGGGMFVFGIFGASLLSNVAAVFRVREGRVAFDPAAFSETWGRQSWKIARDNFSEKRPAVGILLLLMGMVSILGPVIDSGLPLTGWVVLGVVMLSIGAWLAWAELRKLSVGIVSFPYRLAERILTANIRIPDPPEWFHPRRENGYFPIPAVGVFVVSLWVWLRIAGGVDGLLRLVGLYCVWCLVVGIIWFAGKAILREARLEIDPHRSQRRSQAYGLVCLGVVVGGFLLALQAADFLARLQ